MNNTQLVNPQHLSIIITTSPIRSHPDTQVIDDSINSLLKQPSLQKVHIYIVCDGAKIKLQNQYKSGIITAETMANYQKYKQILKMKYNDSNKYTIIQRQNRYGFAQNIKYVMQQYAKTDHILIYQHDHVIQKEINFGKIIQVMRKYQNQVRYVTFMHKSYKNIFAKLIAYLPVKSYLLQMLGKDQNYNMDQRLKQFSSELVQYFNNKFGLPLMPLNFWYDKVHIASRKFYLDVIFNKDGNFDPNRDKNMKTVSFVEDTFGHCMKNLIAKQPQKLLYYGAYILWDEKPIFYHQSGRAFMTQQQRQQQFLKNKNSKNQSDGSNSQNQEDDLPLCLEDMLDIK